VRYPDGALKNLTAAAGYGSSDPAGFQGANAIAVRDPAVAWDGTKALFSMVVGAPTQQYQVATYYWQLYEITGLGASQTPVIKQVPNQPTGFNNHSPIYGTDERILFVSDRPRSGERHLYPQLDEYELSPVNTGLWSLNPASGDLFQLDHSPSGDFTPSIDSYGRVIFTRWDHLQRDQEADADADDLATGQPLTYGTFNYADESAGAAYQLNQRAESFPEPRPSRTDLLAGTNLEGHTLNFFSPWQINEDGTDAETLNHIGRQELGVYAERSFNDDPNLSYLPAAAFRAYMAQRGLALAVSRNVTIRDNADRQQPFNLRVPGGAQTIGAPGKIYDVAAMQFFQADQLRGAGLYDGSSTPRPGRRVLAQPLHDPAAQRFNAAQPGPVPGSVTVAADGSMAAFVPARRATTWQLTDGAGVPVVRERIWLTFQPGEVRVCASCHGLNNQSQAGGMEPVNTPAALVQLLQDWKAATGGGAITARVYLPLLRR